jgi:hypothetical protein
VTPGERFQVASDRIWSDLSKSHATEALVQLADPSQIRSPSGDLEERYSVADVEREFGAEAAKHYAEIAAATVRFRQAVMKTIVGTHPTIKLTNNA